MKEKETIQRLLTIACLITILLSTGVCGASTEGDPNFSYITDDFSVTFSVISENVTGLSWDFGDGATSTDQNPTHAYTSAGEYPVTLTVGDNSVTKIVKVTAALPPVAKFTADVTEGLAPLKVHFTDKSENAEGCEYSWDLGDGTTSSEKTPPTLLRRVDMPIRLY